MVVKYPHNAVIKWFTEPVKDEVTGIETEGQPVEMPVSCRFESAGNSQYSSPGGDTKLVYGYKVFMPVQTFEIPSKAVISKDGVDMDIARADVHQKNTVLWL